ncbi:MAG: DeoR/GlpR family DNA-binding transcription regulator [Candidatus Limivicinus sp.]
MREQRLLGILGTVREKGYATTQELAEKFDVSVSTIRRDLSELNQRGMVAMSKNGAVLISETIVDTPVNFRSTVNAHAKAAIARNALQLVSSGSTIFLDSSSTVLQMAVGLRNMRDIVVVTNSLPMAMRLQSGPVQVRLIGGEMSPASRSFFGPAAEQALRRFNFDLAFFSPVAVTPQGFAAETIESAASLRRAAMEQAKGSALLFDTTKIGLMRPYNIAHIDVFQYLITDDDKHTLASRAIVRRVQL